MLHEPSAAANVQPLITRCAWCRRFAVDAGWLPEDVVHEFVRPGDWRSMTHGICPDCIAELRRRGLSR